MTLFILLNFFVLYGKIIKKIIKRKIMVFIMFRFKKLTAEDYFFITISSYSFLILLSMLIKSFDLSNYNSFIEKSNPTIFFCN